MKKSTLAVSTVVILSLIWSSTWLVIKLGLGYMPPFLSAGLRFLIAFVVLFTIALKMRLPFPKGLAEHRFLFLFSFMIFTFSYGLVYWGEQYINSGLTSVLFSVMPFYTALFSIKMLPSENITMRKMLGIAIGFGGVLLIFSDHLIVDHPLGYWAMFGVLLSPLFSAYGTIQGKIARGRYHPVMLNTLPMLYAGLSFLVLSYLFEGGATVSFTPMALFTLFYLGIIATAPTFLLYFWILKETSAVMISMITYVTPPLALVWGWFVLDESVTWKLLAGMIIIFTGIVFVRERSHVTKKEL